MNSLSPAAQAFWGGIVRHILTGLAGGLVAHGYATQSGAQAYTEELVGAALQGGVMLWSNRVTYWQQIRLIVARSLPSNASHYTVENKVTSLAANNALPTVFTPASVTPTLVHGVVLCLALVAGAASFACGVTVTTQTRQQILTADTVAFSGLSAYQQSEEALWHAKAGWPSAEQHAANGAILSKAFTLVASVAQAGIDLKSGQPLSASVQQMLTDLTTTLSTLVAQSAAGPVQIQAQAADAQSQGAVLKAAVLLKAK